MTSIRKMRRRIRPPKRYENSIASINKRNYSDVENSGDDNLTEDMGKLGKESNEVSMQHEKEVGEIVEKSENNTGCGENNGSSGVHDENVSEISKKGDGLKVNNVNLEDAKVRGNMNERNGTAEKRYDVNTEELVFGTVNVQDAVINEKNGKYGSSDEAQPNLNDSTIKNTNRNYANVSVKDELNKNLYNIPTSTKDNGDEVVIFDENIVEEGSKNWVNTLCGYFVGCNMSPAELRYNIRRMWGKFGVYDIISNGNGFWLFKFRRGDSLDKIVENSPWIVNGKPLMVQKWNPDVCIEKVEPNKLPIWIKLYNIPLEAWSVKGISAISSRLGKPLVMDEMTASMCHKGTGRAAYAKVMVEVDAMKGYNELIKIQYKDRNDCIIRTKFVTVEYSWKPSVCSTCGVFGHNFSGCPKNRVYNGTQTLKEKVLKNQDEEGFTEIRGSKSGGGNNGQQKKQEGKSKMVKEKTQVNMQYRPKENGIKSQEKNDQKGTPLKKLMTRKMDLHLIKCGMWEKRIWKN